METLGSYLAIDRRLAVAGRLRLPDRARGTALFADVSGFTALTEALTQALGARRGAEELSAYMNSVYEALIAEVERYGGSVIAFAGDAITCWFDGDDGRRATTAALRMQAAMENFAELRLEDGKCRTLSVRVGVASGAVRRFVVGVPEHYFLDVMAGSTLSRMAEAAELAHPREVLLDAGSATALRETSAVLEWRSRADSTERYAVAIRVGMPAEPSPWPEIPPLDEALLRPHLLQPVCDRLQAGQGEFLTELRPAVALFLRFEGIDYDADEEAGSLLNQYVVWVQGVVAHYGGFLLSVAMGDKGSHLYCSFGAPIAHENSAWRALAAAHELRSPPAHLGFITRTQIGVSSGTMRTGAYGSLRRRTYGVLGDDVNLAARLMEHAAPGQVLASGQVKRTAGQAFAWQSFPPVKAKGKTEPVAVFALLGPSGREAPRLLEPQYALPMVGRTQELELLAAKLEAVRKGRGQVVSLVAEAGLGKSRLVAEALRLARERGVTGCVGQCLSHGTHTSYLAWQPIWQALFDVNIDVPGRQQAAALEARLTEMDLLFPSRLPLLGAVLNLPIPDNEVTGPLEARLRKASLEGLLVECLRHLSRELPLLLVVEDIHWIDDLSQDLLEVLARAVAQMPVLLLVTQRPPDAGAGREDGFHQLPHSTALTLDGFNDEEAARLVQLKLSHLFAFNAPLPRVLLGRLVARAGGNPFYLEELLNFLKDHEIDFQDVRAIEALEWPDSLHSLVLSRIDRLTETQQAALKVASVVGRLFPAAVVWGLQSQDQREAVAADLARLCQADLTALDRPEPELVYIFKHVVTQEVAYESLPHATRSKLHNEIGLLLERLYTDQLPRHLDLLAFHFDRSLNAGKKREYLYKAGEAAQVQYANQAAISYFERVLPLLTAADSIPVLLKLGKVWELTGEWKKAGTCYQRAFEAAESEGDRHAQARCQAATGDLLRKQGLYAEARDWLGVARTCFEELGDVAGVGQALHAAGTVAAMQGDYATAQTLYEQSLALRRQLGDKPQIASLCSNLGIIARFHSDRKLARELSEQSLELRRELGDRWAIANSLNNLGVLLRDAGELARARALLEEALTLNRQVGDRWAVANTLSSLAEVTLDQKDWPATQEFLHESLAINLELGDRTAVAFILECFAAIAVAKADPRLALRMVSAAYALRQTLGSPLSPAEQSRLDRYLEPARRALSEEERDALERQGSAMGFEEAVSLAQAAPLSSSNFMGSTHST
ncbi:MAG TPA: tetratricopeptide repeat protein [Candidatus Acidoferrum sp.]|jgi:adenylate cyclase|nr:tetratricopeptide repeat protein [Candidatus Acidoferrum sp.]